MISRILNFLRESEKKTTANDQDERLMVDRKILDKKPEFLKVVFDIQREMMKNARLSDSKEVSHLELGAGVLPMKMFYPHVKSTDVVPSAHLDGVLDASKLDLEDNSIDNLFLQNTFHHLPDPQAFFNEAFRVLKSGGRIVIVDPYHNIFSSLLFPRLFSSETFEKSGSWCDASTHPMSGANQALTYIVFCRDLELMKRNNPSLTLELAAPLKSGLRYLLTGGLNFKQLAPNSVLKIVRYFEKYRLVPRFLSIHWIIVLQKS
jgi:SAM-dependent methyltransferase